MDPSEVMYREETGQLEDLCLVCRKEAEVDIDPETPWIEVEDLFGLTVRGRGDHKCHDED